MKNIMSRGAVTVGIIAFGTAFSVFPVMALGKVAVLDAMTIDEKSPLVFPPSVEVKNVSPSIGISPSFSTVFQPIADTVSGFWAANGANIFNTNFGNVGIGTSTPAHKLTVNGDIGIIGGNQLRFVGTNGSDIGSITASGGVVSIEANAQVINPSALTYFDVVNSSMVRLEARGNGGAVGTIDNSSFSIMQNGTNYLTISNGNVGIRTNNPETALHVSSTPVSVGLARFEGSSEATLVGLSLKNNAPGGRDWRIYSGGPGEFGILDVTGGNIPFRIAGGVPSNVLYINSSGSVGIRTTNPAYTLDVNGAIRSVAAQFAGNTFFDAHCASVGMLACGQQRFNVFGTFGVSETAIFSGNVGIGTTNPSQKLEVAGGVRLNATTLKPSCGSAERGTMWFTARGAGLADALEVCAKDTNGVYAWRTVSFDPISATTKK